MRSPVESGASPSGARLVGRQPPRPPGRRRTWNVESLTEALAEDLGAHAHLDGATAGLWPKSVVYRLTGPTRLRWNGSHGLTVGVITRAPRARAHIGGRHLSAPASYVLVEGPRRLDVDVTAASAQQPVLALVLELDPHLVHAVTTGLGAGPPGAARTAAAGPRLSVSELDNELTGIVVRFLRSLWVPDDRRVVAPLHLAELVYRLARREDHRHDPHSASPPVPGPMGPDLMGIVVEFISANLSEPLTVDALAAQACLSPSAFSRAFRDLTGQAPYQFVKTLRMERAQALLDEGCLGVGDVARAVGYTSVSHFIREFRGRFGMTPGAARTLPA